MSDRHTPDTETANRLRRRPHRHISQGKGRCGISFEYFPAADDATDDFGVAAGQLDALSPEFVSVTYGANGSEQGRSFSTIRQLQRQSATPVAAHFTACGQNRDEADAIIHSLIQLGVDRFVALRGDAAPGQPFAPHRNGYRNAAELVAAIKAIGPYDVAVAAYPEVHPDSASVAADLDNLCAKVDAGADRIITQFCYAPEKVLRLRDALATRGVDVPLIAGILPIHRFAQVDRFAQRCGASIPAPVRELLANLDDQPEILHRVATTLVAEQCTQLIENGIRHLHFYTLNRAAMTRDICEILGFRPQARDERVDVKSAVA